MGQGSRARHHLDRDARPYAGTYLLCGCIGNSKILIQSDVTNIPELFLRNPDWHVAFDVDGDLAQKTRHKFYDMAAAEKATVVGFHFTFPCIGHVEKDGAKYRLIPSAWNPVI